MTLLIELETTLKKRRCEGDNVYCWTALKGSDVLGRLPSVLGRRQCIPDLCDHNAGCHHVTPLVFNSVGKRKRPIVVLIVLHDEGNEKTRVQKNLFAVSTVWTV
jgi:hypothetical protein